MPTRRAFLGAALASCAVERRSVPDTAAEPIETDGEPIEPVTSNEDFYRIAYSGWSPPEGYREAWTLTLELPDGTVEVWTLDDLRALGGEEVEHTLMCIGSTSGRAISNAKWRGVRLRDLVGDVSTEWIVFFCGDDYHTPVPGTDADLMLVWEMNGVDLPDDHGGPLRVLTPGRYGMKNPKWVERIVFTDVHDVGTWEELGWSDSAEYQVASWIHAPADRSVLPVAGCWLVGSAYAGRAPVAKVEVSDDGGATWSEAEITYEGRENVWTLWRFFWLPRGEGVFPLAVRATTADGRVQSQLEDYDADRDGYEGLHSLTVTTA